MLSYYHGSNLFNLADQLIEQLHNKPSKNILAPEIFVVQNHGMAHWLSLYLAQKNGIAANLSFEFPAERIWKLLRTMDADIPESLPSDRQPMTWSLMQLLQDDEILSGFKNLEHYVRDEHPGQRALRTWKLSSKIADVFDQYLVYRPDLILAWEEGKLMHKGNQAERWQAKLWNKLIDHWQKDYPGKWLHRAELEQELLKSIDNGTLPSTKLPQRVSFFGISAMPPVFIETMIKLSKLMDVTFYQLSVDPHITDCNSFKNPLLQSLGKQGADFMNLLTQNISTLQNASAWTSVNKPEPKPVSIFQVIQADLKQDHAHTDSNPRSVPADPSLQVHSCHSAMREVEVLYDQLLAILDANPQMTADDILIMMPDIESYAPIIEAVFEAPDEGQPPIPYSIADQGIKGSHQAVESFLKILKLCESRFKVTDVMALLDFKAIQQAFGFKEDDLNALQKWIHENRVRWGIDGSFKQEMDLPNSDSFTWKTALNRLILGYAVKQHDDELYQGIFPYNEIETSDNVELAGRFSNFMHALFSIHNLAKNHRTPKEWADVLAQITDTFLPDTREYFRELATIRSSLSKLKESASLGGFSEKLPFTIVQAWLHDQLQQQATGGGVIGRGITFSSLRPMRSIPFKMIGMIGMDEGAFPQSPIPIEFNLIHNNPRAGDPVGTDEDRYVFLENLISAQTHIYFSYVGQSNRQDAEFPPSVILSELLNYVEEYYGLPTKDLLTKHRLQGFSEDYFNDDKLFTYSGTQLKICQKLLAHQSQNTPFLKDRLSQTDPDWKKVSINDLISFFQHPAKFLLQNRLGIYLGETDTLTEDREPFLLSGLDSYKVGQELLDRFMKDKSLSSFEQNIQARDMLPEGWTGDQAYRKKLEDVQNFGGYLKEQITQKLLDDHETDIEIEDFRIVGKLSNIYEHALIDYRYGNMRPKDLISLWIRHLCLQFVKSQNHPGESQLFTRDKKEPFAAYKLSSVEDGQVILQQLLNLYWQGLQYCCYFFPDASHAYAREVCLNKGDEEAGLYSASKKWIREWGSYPGEAEDPYNMLMLGTKNPLSNDAFKKSATQFWAPFFEVLNVEDR